MLQKKFTRRKSFDLYKKVIQLRKSGYSYTEIKKQTGVAKSTINNWLAKAGLTLTPEHLNIQIKKRSENHILGTAAAKITKDRRRELALAETLSRLKDNFKDQLFISGIMLYEAEGSKGDAARFSNSDYRLIQVFVKFITKYFNLSKENMGFRLAIHEVRKDDLIKILGFWSKKLKIKVNIIHVTWKRNIVTHRRLNPDYMGQMEVSVHGESYMSRKLLAISDIILTQHLRLD